MDPNDSLFALIEDARNAASALDWAIEIHADADDWIAIRHRSLTLRAQGWKIHIAASPPTAVGVLQPALAVLFREASIFKVCRSLRRLAHLNSGRAALSQIGKFITVYPVDDEQAVRFARLLDAATGGFPGPNIPSDRRLNPRSAVHYRFGSFGSLMMQTRTGEIISAIVDPNGETVPDRRLAVYSPPDWADDPFLSAGAASPPPAPPSPLVGDRYLKTSVIHHSARGSISYAVDLDNPRLCILKDAVSESLRDDGNKDARDRLRHEARVLGRLHDERFPTVYDVIDGENTTAMVMSDIDGVTLEDRIVDLARSGSLLTSPQVARWGRSIAELLAVIHARGLVYRDLKSTNVMVTPNDDIRLIDFELACDIGTPGWSGTRGYMSPQHAAGSPAGVQDDIYALGAILAYMATNAEPSNAPDEHALLDRRLALLNPALDPRLDAVIARCLAPDPSRRYTTARDVDVALRAVIDEPFRSPDVPYGAESSVADRAVARDRHLRVARAVGDMICAVARDRGTGIAWSSRHRISYNAEVTDVNTGSAGTILALAELVDTFRSAEHERVLASAAYALATRHRPRGERLPGLYVGEAGAASALLRAGQVLGNEHFVAEALRRARAIARLEHTSPDLFNGTAGRLRAHLFLWDATGLDEQREFASAAGDVLLSRAETRGEDGCCWPIPDGYGSMSGMAFYGYAHGAAGIGDALLDLYDVTGDERYRSAARGAALWLQAASAPALTDGSGLNWPISEQGSFAPPYWCHGATGIGRFWLHAAALDVVPESREIAQRALATTARGSRWANPTVCHGLAGSIDLLLDAYQVTKDDEHLREASSFGELLHAFARNDGAGVTFPSESPTTITPDFQVGYAGVAVALLRLADPDMRPSNLSRKGFRFKYAASR